MPYYDTRPTETSIIADLAERQRRSEANRRLESATVGSGGIILDGGAIIVKDSSGAEIAAIGDLGNGRTGISVIGSSGFTTFDQIAFGTRTAKAPSKVYFGRASTYGSDHLPANTWHYLSPNIENFQVTGGRMTVTVGAELRVGGEGSGQLYFGAGYFGPGGVFGAQFADCVSLARSAGMDNLLGASREIVFEGLPEGTYSVRTACWLGTLGDPGIYGEISNRSVAVRLL